MKFFAPTDAPIHLGLTSGHTALVTKDGVELSEPFHQEALAQGALTQEATKPTFDRATAIREALQAMVEQADPADFTKDGRPDLRKLKNRLEFDVSRAEVETAWAEVSAPD